MRTRSRGVIPLLFLVLGLVAIPDLTHAQRRGRSSDEKDHRTIREAFRPIVAPARASTVRIVAGEDTLALGLLVDSAGSIVTKASELRGEMRAVLADGREFRVGLSAVDQRTDLALLTPREDVGSTPPIAWENVEAPAVGSLLATVGLEEDPIAIGVVSVGSRPLKERGVLGIRFDDSGTEPRIGRVYPNTGAANAGVENGDVVKRIEGLEVDTIEAVVEVLGESSPGDVIELLVRRGDRELDIQVTLGRQPTAQEDQRTLALSGSLSERRWDFPSVLQHDTFLLPRECGGPVVDLDGRVVGLNIARAGRVASFALPVGEALASVERLRSGSLPPGLDLLLELDDESLELRLAALEESVVRAELERAEAERAIADAREQLRSLRAELEKRRKAREPRRLRL